MKNYSTDIMPGNLESFLANVSQLFEYGKKLNIKKLSKLATQLRCSGVKAQSQSKPEKAARHFARARQIESVIQLHQTTKELQGEPQLMDFNPQKQAS